MPISETTRSLNVPLPHMHLVWPVSSGEKESARAIRAALTMICARSSGSAPKRASAATRRFSGKAIPPPCAYKVVSGVVRLCKHMAGGRRHIVQISFPGDFFSVLDFEKHSFTAEAVTDVVLMSYPQSAIAALGEERPSVRAAAFLRSCRSASARRRIILPFWAVRPPRNG